MKKEIIKLIFLLLIAIVMAGCEQSVKLINEEPSEPPGIVDSHETENSHENIGSGISEEPPATEELPEFEYYEYSEEEKSHLSFEFDKVVLIVGLTGGVTDDLSFLKNKYPDIELLSVEYIERRRGVLLGEDYRDEIWYSETTGLSYHISHTVQSAPPAQGGPLINFLRLLSGEMDALVSGLSRVVNTNELMDALGIPESDWAVGEAPKAPVNYVDYVSYFSPVDSTYVKDDNLPRFITPDEICVIVPDAVNPDKRYPNAIKITPKRPGYISPTDEFIICTAAAWP